VHNSCSAVGFSTPRRAFSNRVSALHPAREHALAPIDRGLVHNLRAL
jgi:hypothetical protein